MLLNFVNGNKYKPGYVNIGLSDCGDKPIAADLWLTKKEVFRLRFPEGVVAFVRIGCIFRYFSPVEGCAFLYNMRNFKIEKCANLSIDGYGSWPLPDKNLTQLLQVCGYIMGIMPVREEQFVSPLYAQFISGDDDKEKIVLSQIEQFLLNLANGNEKKYLFFRREFSQLTSDDNLYMLPVNHIKLNKPQIILNIVGGLGDQFFRYAAARLAAIKNNAELKFDDTNMRIAPYMGRSCILQYFNTVGNHASKQDYANLLEIQIAVKNPYVVDCNNLQKFYFPNNEVMYLTSGVEWPLSAEIMSLLAEIMPVLRKELTLREPPAGENALIAADISANYNSVSIHFRLTDFVHIGLNLPLEYYLKAMAAIEKIIPNPHYFVFSDEIEEVKKLLPTSQQITFINNNDAQHGHEDFRLMTMCHHHIICKSSFSWWAAMLAENEDKIVLHPNYSSTPKEWIAIEGY